jgi:hypothetical protein
MLHFMRVTHLACSLSVRFKWDVEVIVNECRDMESQYFCGELEVSHASPGSDEVYFVHVCLQHKLFGEQPGPRQGLESNRSYLTVN